MEDTRLPICVMLEELVEGVGYVGGQGKEWMGCFLDDLRAFGINADQWTTAAQYERERRKTVEQGVEHFMAKWIAAKRARAGLRHAMVCPNVTEGPRRGKPKSSGLVLVFSPLLTSHIWREFVSSGRLVGKCHGVFLWRYICFCFASCSSLCLR